MKEQITENIIEHEKEIARLKRELNICKYLLEKDKNRLIMLEEKDDKK